MSNTVFLYRLRSNRTLKLLEQATTPGIVVAIENNAFANYPIVQQYGSTAHYSVNVREYLDKECPGRWIQHIKPPRSPDPVLLNLSWIYE